MDHKTRKAHSVRAHLMNKARSSGRPFMEILQYYGIEKFLLRMSASTYAQDFILKGALLLRSTGISETRPTRDIDLSRVMAQNTGQIIKMVKDCCQLEVEEDGMTFEHETVVAEEIREDQAYSGIRIKFQGRLGNARIPMQIDIGFGDAISPCPLWIEYPVLLDGDSPHLLAYTLESAIAEKYQAMIYLDMVNSRMKDFYDIWFLLNNRQFHGNTLKKAVEMTFKRRKTDLTEKLPTALSDAFYLDEGKKAQWNAFKKKTGLQGVTEELKDIINELYRFLWPIHESLIKAENFDYIWVPKKGWHKN